MSEKKRVPRILINAIHGKSKSEPFTVYNTKNISIEDKFILRMDEVTDNEGEERLRLSNADMGLVQSHATAYIEERLTGFRRKTSKGVTIVICEKFDDGIPAVATAAKLEVF